MNNRLKFNLLFCLALLLSGCQSAWSQPFPEAEIVYQTGDHDQPQIGFVNADGSNPVVLETGVYLAKPTWASGGSQIYALAKSSQDHTLGYPAYWVSNSKFKQCRQWFNFTHIEEVVRADGSMQVLIMDTKVILFADLARCEPIEVLVDISDHGEQILYGASLVSEGQGLLYGLEKSQEVYNRDYQIMKMDLKTRQSVALVQGINPSWSPNGLQIVYVQADGIYIMNADGTQPHQLIEHNFVNSYFWFSAMSPAPRWSPDGKWVVYHRCEQDSCFVTENSIYKVDVATGIEQRIIDGGAFPDWRK